MLHHRRSRGGPGTPAATSRCNHPPGAGAAHAARQTPARKAGDLPRIPTPACDTTPCCLALVEGPSGVIASGFTVADPDALAAAETALEQRGIRVEHGDGAAARSRRMTEFIAFDDPFGNRIELATGQRSSTEPVRLSRASGITEFGHLRLDAPDVPEAYRFWSTTFNARVLDWVGDGACLMRIDPVHHSSPASEATKPRCAP